MMKDEWRRILQHRSVKDKIGIAVDCDLAPVGDLNIVTDLVREGIITFVERAALLHLVIKGRRGVNADIYRLTPKGIALCDSNGIERQ